MLSRGAEAVRLCIRLRSVERIVEYLAVVGWPGDEADLRDVLEPMARSVDRVLLDIDVGETVCPKIGLECYFDGNRQPGREPRWGAFLNSLVLNGLCTADKREALLAYPGYVDENAHERALAGGASAGFATARRALPEHLRALAPPRQDRVPAGRADRSQGLPGRQPPLAHARLRILVGPAVGKERHDLSSSEEQRLARARRRGWEALASLAERLSEPLCPWSASPRRRRSLSPYGDLVPLGFLLRASTPELPPPHPSDALWKTCCATSDRDYCGRTIAIPSSPASTRRWSCKGSAIRPA